MKTNHLSVIITLLVIMFLSFGCKQNSHPIAGNSYCHKIEVDNSTTKEIYTFSKYGKCEKIFYSIVNDKETKSSFAHLKWEVNGDEVTVLHDNSTYWKQAARGTTLAIFTYNKERDVLICEDKEYSRWP